MRGLSRAAQAVLVYVLLSTSSGSGWMSTSKRSCTLFSTSVSSLEQTKVIARPRVPKRPGGWGAKDWQ